MGISSGQFRKHRLAALFFLGYLAALGIFVFFPRPILESGDPSAVSKFLEDHANLFYKILYADTTSVARGNYFMLTPFIILAHLVFPKVRLTLLFAFGAAISATIELVQRAIPGRVADLVDFYSNTASLLIGVVAIKVGHLLLAKFAKTE